MCERDFEQEVLDLLMEEAPEQIALSQAVCSEWAVDWQGWLFSLSLLEFAHLRCASPEQLTGLVRSYGKLLEVQT